MEGDVEIVVAVGHPREKRLRQLVPGDLLVQEEGVPAEILRVEPLQVEPGTGQIPSSPWQWLLFIDPSLSKRGSIYWKTRELAELSARLTGLGTVEIALVGKDDRFPQPRLGPSRDPKLVKGTLEQIALEILAMPADHFDRQSAVRERFRERRELLETPSGPLSALEDLEQLILGSARQEGRLVSDRIEILLRSLISRSARAPAGLLWLIDGFDLDTAGYYLEGESSGFVAGIERSLLALSPIALVEEMVRTVAAGGWTTLAFGEMTPTSELDRPGEPLDLLVEATHGERSGDGGQLGLALDRLEQRFLLTYRSALGAGDAIRGLEVQAHDPSLSIGAPRWVAPGAGADFPRGPRPERTDADIDIDCSLRIDPPRETLLRWMAGADFWPRAAEAYSRPLWIDCRYSLRAVQKAVVDLPVAWQPSAVTFDLYALEQDAAGEPLEESRLAQKVYATGGGRSVLERSSTTFSRALDATQHGAASSRLLERAGQGRGRVDRDPVAPLFVGTAGSFSGLIQVSRQARQLRLKLAEDWSRLEGSATLTVPPPGPGASEPVPGLLSVGLLLRSAATQPVYLVPFENPLVVERARAEVLVIDPRVHTVDLLLDGEPVKTLTEPSWAGWLALENVPVPHVLQAIARDRHGSSLGEDRLELNQGANRFLVRIEAPREVAEAGDYDVVVDVQVPAGRRVEEVEIFEGTDQIAVLGHPPYVVRASLRSAAAGGFLRVVARLDDGRWAEDAVPFGGGRDGFVERTRVDLVEVHVLVKDRAGRLVSGLAQEDFELLQDGTAQIIEYFSPASEAPLNLGLVVDVSQSMESSMPVVRAAARQFLQSLIGPRDQAFLMAFQDRPMLVQPLTPNVERLSRAMSLLVAAGNTALNDAVALALLQLQGDLTGRRALVLLTDGGDQGSLLERWQVLEMARRAAVPVYVIRIGGGQSPGAYPEATGLRRFATVTGGRAFSLHGTGALVEAYAEIAAELRSQYLLGFQPDPAEEGDRWRRLEVRVHRSGLRARAASGYRTSR